MPRVAQDKDPTVLLPIDFRYSYPPLSQVCHMLLLTSITADLQDPKPPRCFVTIFSSVQYIQSADKREWKTSTWSAITVSNV